MGFDIDLHGENFELITDDFLIFQQEIELAIKIIQGEIWNRAEGLDIQNYVFNKYVSVYRMKQEIKRFINNECSSSHLFAWDIDVKLIIHDNSDMLLIEVSIEGDENQQTTNKYYIQ